MLPPDYAPPEPRAMTTVEKLAENVYAKLAFRWGVPALLTIALLLGRTMVEDMRAGVAQLRSDAIQLQARVIALEAESSGRWPAVNARLDRIEDKLDRLIETKRAEVTPLPPRL